MARIKQGILGGFSGKVSNVIGSSWKGLAVMKSRPLSVANPRTSGQVAQRTKFAGAVAFAVAILTTIIKPLWDRFASAQSGYNAFIQANLAAFTSDGDLLPASLSISKGKMGTTSYEASASAGTDQVSITWDDDSGSSLKLSSDIPYALAVNLVTNDIAISEGDGERQQGFYTLSFPSSILVGQHIAVYLAFKRADGTVVSNSVYTDIVVGA